MNGKLQGLSGCQVRPMTDDESRLLLTLICAARNGKDLPEMEKQLRDSRCMSYLILTSRLEAFKKGFSPTLDIDVAVQIFCALLCDRPGKVVMWAYTLNEMFVKQGRKVTMEDWINEFPMGVPTEDEYSAMWELQKVKPPAKGDNMIDDFSNWGTP